MACSDSERFSDDGNLLDARHVRGDLIEESV